VPAPAERLSFAILGFHGSGVDTLHQQENERLMAMCRTLEADCLSRNMRQIRRRLAVLRAAPDARSPIVAHVHAVLRVNRSPTERLAVGLDVELATEPGVFRSWIADVGDWGYGLYISGAHERGNWVQLIGAPLPQSAWLDAETPTLTATIVPLEHEIVALTEVRAIWPDGGRRAITKGTYLIERVAGGEIRFRAEVPSDFACGENIKPPAIMPPTLRTTPAELFDSAGRPRFTFVYQKGC
jgi:hypothetical protein